MKPKIHSPIFAALAGLALAASAHGQTVLFADSYESYPVDLSVPTTTLYQANLSTAVRDEVTATPFDNPNQYVELSDTSPTESIILRSVNIAGASAALTTFAFDFWEPSTVGNSGLIVGYAMENNQLTSSGHRLRFNLQDGTITGLSTAASNTYSEDAPYRLYIIFNDTASAVSYTGGSIPSGVAHVWLKPVGGTAVFAGTRTVGNSQTASYRVSFRTFSGNLQDMLVDNVTLVAGIDLPGAFVPELVSTLPADDALGATEGTNLVATFDQPIVKGTGNIIIKNLTDSTTFDTIAVSDAQVTISGYELIIDPTSDLDPLKAYAIQLDAGVIKDLSGQPYVGIVDPDVDTWNFTTGASVTATFAANERIEGRTNNQNDFPIGYYINGGLAGRVGIGGGTTSRRDSNLVLSYDLPTLPAGTTVGSATFHFEISNYNNNSGADPALNVYLLDSTDPSGTGTAFFYHGPADPNASVELVGTTDLSLPVGIQEDYDPDEQDQSYPLTGDALALLQSFYGGDHIPDQPTVYFRFNLDNLVKPTEVGENADLTGAVFDRYFILDNGTESGLVVTGESVGGSNAYDTWAGGFSPNPGLATDNADPDSLNNLLEFAFGTNPNVSDANQLEADGSLNGVPIVQSSGGGGGITFDYLFIRRTDFGTSGSVTYTPQFSGDLEPGGWYDSTATVDVVTGSTAGYQVVKVAYPAPALPNGKKARFARLLIELVP